MKLYQIVLFIIILSEICHIIKHNKHKQIVLY
jgi:hypothetical protein